MSRSSSDSSYYREQQLLAAFTLERYTEKPDWPDALAQVVSLSRVSSRGFGSTLNRGALPRPVYGRGVRTALCKDEIDVPEMEDRLTSRDPRFRRSMNNDFEYSVSSDYPASMYTAGATAGVVVFNYRNKVLELRRPHSYDQLTKAYKNARNRFLRYCVLAEGDFGKWWLEACVMGYYVSQHHILILYEYDNKQRKIHALRSYFGDSYGQDVNPVGDVLMFPRKPPKNDNIYFECLIDICRAIQVIHHFHGNYRAKPVPRLSSEAGIVVKNVTNVFRTHSELRISNFFKPVFLPVYFEIEVQNSHQPKTVMALKMIEKCCLAFEHICETALLWRHVGKAFAAAQAAQICTKYMNLLLNTSLLSDCLAHTHLLAEWQMGNALFLLVCGMGDIEEEATAYRQFDRTTNFVPNFISALEEFKKFFPNEVAQIQKEYPWVFPFEKRVALKLGVRSLRKCRIPGSWCRSHFRLFYMATLQQLSFLRAWACDIEPFSKSYSYEKIINSLDKVINEAQSARADIPEAPQEAGEEVPWETLRDVVVLQRMVTARALRYKFTLLTAWSIELDQQSDDASEQAMISPSESSSAGYDWEEVDQLGQEVCYKLHFPMMETQIQVLNQAEAEQQKVLALLRSPSTHVTKYWHRVHNLALVTQAFDLFTLQMDSLHRFKINAVERIVEIVQSLGHLCAAGDITPPKMERNRWGLYWEQHDALCTVIALHCSALARVYLHCSKREPASTDPEAPANKTLRVARYFQHITALCQGRPAVALHLLHRHCATLQHARASYLSNGKPAEKHMCRLVQLLRLVVDMLPFLWDEAVAEAENGPSDCPFFYIKQKVLPFTPRELQKFSSPCSEGLKHALDTMSTLPNKPKSGAVPFEEQNLTNDEERTSIVCEAALQATLDSTKFKRLDSILMECVNSLCSDCFDEDHVSVAKDSANLVFLHLCADLKKHKKTRLMPSTIKIAVVIFSIAFGVIGSASSMKLSSNAPELIRNKVKDIMQSVGSFLDEPPMEDTVETISQGTVDETSVSEDEVEATEGGSENGGKKFEEIVENLPDFDNFLKWVGSTRPAKRFTRAQSVKEIASHIERILRDLLHQIVAVFGCSDTFFYYYLAADSFLNFICMLNMYLQNKDALSVINSLSKVFIISMRGTIERKLETNDWCASPEDVHTHPLLRGNVSYPEELEKSSEPEEIIEKKPAEDEHKVILGEVQFSYDPYEHLPAHLKEEETQCLRFEQFSMLRAFHEATGEFTCREQGELTGVVLSEARRLIMATIDDVVYELSPIIAAKKTDLLFTDIHGEIFKITASTLANLGKERDSLMNESPENFVYVLAKAVYRLDELVFNGSLHGLLRGKPD